MPPIWCCFQTGVTTRMTCCLMAGPASVLKCSAALAQKLLPANDFDKWPVNEAIPHLGGHFSSRL